MDVVLRMEDENLSDRNYRSIGLELCEDGTIQETFGQNFPEDLDGTLDCVSISLTAEFNRRGSLLAVGCNDGRIYVYDFLTRGIATIILAHVQSVCSLSWNRNGHQLISASTDNTVCIWQVDTGECNSSYRFPSPVYKVQFHPRRSDYFLVCPLKHPAVLMKTDSTHQVIPLHKKDNDTNIVASFDRRGQYIYTCNSKGMVMVNHSTDLKLVASFRIQPPASNIIAIKSIEFSRRGNAFLLNASDRVVRIYESGEVLACGIDGHPEPIQKLQDLVNKSLWKKCSFSGDGEYVVASSARAHSLYIWERSVGTLVKILHGTKGELLLDVVWHPIRSVIASVSNGIVSIWSQNQVENWSAFAPDFKELDENVEYEERESEFDIQDEDKDIDDKDLHRDSEMSETEDEIEVDVTTVDKIAIFCSSDEEKDDDDFLLYLPISPDVEDFDNPQENTNTLKVNSPKPKKPKKQTKIELPNAPHDAVHPLLERNSNKKANGDRIGSRRIGSNRSKSSHSRDSKKSRPSKSKSSPDLKPIVNSAIIVE